MKHDELEAALRSTIADHRVSRGERKAVRALLADAALDEHTTAVVRAKAFDIAREALETPRAQEVLGWVEDVVGLLAAGDAPSGQNDTEPEIGAWFSPGRDPLHAIVSQMRRVRRSADICVFTITDDRISDGILAIAARGVKVRVISDRGKSTDQGSDLNRLVDGGIDVAFDRSDAHMHHKFALFDDVRLLTGSFNWTRAASGENHENVLVTSEPELVTSYRAEFERLWARYS